MQRLMSLAVAFALHVLCLWVLIPPFTTSSSPWETSKDEVRTPAAASKPAAAPVETSRQDQREAYVPSPPSLRVYGFEFDLRKIRVRWRDLFPFVTTSLSFQSVARVQDG